MKFLNLGGLKHFYDKYIRPLKGAAYKDVANDLITTEEGSVLDARQGKALEDKKVDKSNIINSLLATVAGYALDARQGKILDERISEINTYLAESFRLSETEIETPEKFIDGKRIYSMTIVTNDTIPAGRDLTIPLSLSVADRLWIDPQNSYIRSATQCFPLPLPRFSSTSESCVGIWCNTAGIRLFSDGGWNNAWEKCVTLRYTKKTD